MTILGVPAEKAPLVALLSSLLASELYNLARSYLRLAMQAEQNSRLDLTYETPLSKDDDAAAKR